MERFEPIFFDDAKKFLEKLEELSSQEGSRFVFRGQSNAGWCLLPVAHRNNDQSKVIDEFVDRNVCQYRKFIKIFRWKDETEERFKIRFELALRYFVETQLIHLFHETALEWELLQYYNQPVGIASHQHIKHYLTSCEVPFRTDNHPMEVKAQLHGVPTKRLDVSGSYQAAIYYALSGMSQTYSNDIVVWALRLPLPFSQAHTIVSADSLPNFRHRGNWIHQMLADPYSDHDYYFSNRQRAPFERKLHKTTNFRLLLSHSEIERLRQEFEISDPFPYVFGIPIFEPLSKVENRINCRRAMFNKLIDEKASELKIDWEKVPPDEDWQHLRSNTRMIYRHKTEDCCHLVYSDGIRYTYLDSSFEYVYGVLFSDVFSGESSDEIDVDGRTPSWLQTHQDSDFLVYLRV